MKQEIVPVVTYRRHSVSVAWNVCSPAGVEKQIVTRHRIGSLRTSRASEPHHISRSPAEGCGLVNIKGRRTDVDIGKISSRTLRASQPDQQPAQACFQPQIQRLRKQRNPVSSGFAIHGEVDPLTLKTRRVTKFAQSCQRRTRRINGSADETVSTRSLRNRPCAASASASATSPIAIPPVVPFKLGRAADRKLDRRINITARHFPIQRTSSTRIINPPDG